MSVLYISNICLYPGEFEIAVNISEGPVPELELLLRLLIQDLRRQLLRQVIRVKLQVTGIQLQVNK